MENEDHHLRELVPGTIGMTSCSFKQKHRSRDMTMKSESRHHRKLFLGTIYSPSQYLDQYLRFQAPL